MHGQLRPILQTVAHSVTKHTRRAIAFTKLSIVSTVLVTASLVPMIAFSGTAHADTDCSPNGVAKTGSSWSLTGGGVNICNHPGDGSNVYVNNINGQSTRSGTKWECVEMVNRLYLTKGWTTANWYGNGGGTDGLIYHVPSGLSAQFNGSISYINPGDVITLNYGTFGHAGIIDSISGTTYNILNQNAALTSSAYLSSGSLNGGNATLQMNAWAGYTVQGVVHHPATSTTSATATSSQITPDGVQHVFTGDSSGAVYDISWGNGSPLTQWQVASLGAPVTAMSSQVVNGVVNVYAAVGKTVQDIYWGNGTALGSWQVGSFGSNVTALSSQVVGGVQNVYASTGSTVQDIYWGNGTALGSWQVGSFGSNVGSISSQVVSGVQHVYSSVGATLEDTYWGNGQSLTTWGVATLSAPIVALTAQLINGVQQVDAATSTTVQNISWGNGQSITVWGVDSVSGMTLTSVSSQMVVGVQHVYAGTTANTVRDISWGNGQSLTVWNPGTSLGGTVVGLSAQLISGVQQVDAITSSAAWNISWGNGSPLTQWAVSNSL